MVLALVAELEYAAVSRTVVREGVLVQIQPGLLKEKMNEVVMANNQ